jgi:putative addiction module killer protein
MIIVQRTDEFIGWLRNLRDLSAKARIAQRIDRIAAGNFGDTKSVGDGVSELRFAFGPGYRIYYTMKGEVVVILLSGGDKDTQSRDIEKAKKLAQEL